MNILIVDDSKMVRNVIRLALIQYFQKKGLSHLIFEASDGKEALNQIDKNRVDILFLDWNMPKMDGETVVDELKKAKKLDNIYVIMATTDGSKASVLKMLKKGVQGYMVKPFNEDVIFKSLDKAIEHIKLVG